MRFSAALSTLILSLSCVLGFAFDIANADVEEVYLSPHFHYDPVFQEDQNDYTDVGFDRVRRFMEALREDPDYAVIFSEIDYLKPYFDTHPEERAEMLRLIAENRIETGGSYNEPNEMSISGEGIIRNIIYGRGYHEGVLGDEHALVYQPYDVFGHTIQLTQILAKSRYIGALWRKGNPPSEKYVRMSVPGLPPDFMGLSPDGSTLHHRREHYKAVSGTVSEEDLVRKVNEKKQLQDELGLVAEFGLLSSADFAYPETWLAGNCTRLKELDLPIIISGPSAYYKKIQEQLEKEEARLPEVSRDLSLYHAGTALSRVNLKIGNRLTEWALMGAEEFSVAASLMGAQYPGPALDKAWRLLLFNQHHDGITGTCCDRSFFDMIASYREALELAEEAFTGATEFLASNIDYSGIPDGAMPIVVFNRLGWDRGGIVTTGPMEIPWDNYSLKNSAGDDVKFQEVEYWGSDAVLKFASKKTPSVGYEVYYLMKSDESVAAPEMEDATTISNEYFEIVAAPKRGGCITGIKDLVNGRDVIAEGGDAGNELIVLAEDSGPAYPAWELSTKGVVARSCDNPASVKVQKTTIGETLVVNGEIPGYGGYEQEIRLYDGIDTIDFLTTITKPAKTGDTSDRYLWMVRFPAALEGTAPVVEDRFFAAARRRSLKPLSYRTDLEKMYTFSAPYSALNWVEEGVAVRLDILDKDGQAVDAIALQLCEIVHTDSKDSVLAAEKLQRALIQRGVTCTPSLDTDNHDTDLLNRNFRFVLDIADDNTYVADVLGAGSKKADAVKEKISRDGVARLLVTARANDLEIRNVPTLVLAVDSVESMNSMIDEITSQVLGDTVFTLWGYEDARSGKKPVVPDDYGIAIINRGNLLHSFDNDGAIVMGLFHSAPWASVRMDTPFEFPEQKNHRFEYSLFPHSGDWREADTYRRGMEVNAPLKAVVAQRGEGELPLTMSFFEIESDTAALSSVKASGNLLSKMVTGEPEGPQNGVAMRFYEAEGIAGKVKVKFFSPVESAQPANLMEEVIDGEKIDVADGNTIEFAIQPNEIKTVLVTFKDAKAPETGAPQLARSKELSDPLYTNYWDVNHGAAYMENSPVSVFLDFPPDKKLPDPAMISAGIAKPEKHKIGKGANPLRMIVSNNSADEPLKGKLKIEAPGTWKAEPSEVEISLAPLEGQSIDLNVFADKPVKAGFVRATLETDDGSYYDVLQVGRPEELDAKVELLGRDKSGCYKFAVNVTNNQGDRIDGTIEPIGPVETWPVALTGELSLFELSPRMEPYIVMPDESVEKVFSACTAFDTEAAPFFWVMFRITYNGELLYKPVVVGE